MPFLCCPTAKALIPSKLYFHCLTASLALILVGCRPNDAPVAPKKDAGTQSELQAGAKSELQELVARYRKLDRYADQATISLSYRADNRNVRDSATITTRFARPNQIDLDIKRGINALTLQSDGKQIWTQIIDPTTDNLYGQVIQNLAPEKLTPAGIYSATELVNPESPNAAVSALFGMPLNLELSQLGLLLNGEIFPQLIDNSDVERLEELEYRGETCHRYVIKTSGGDYLLWWSPQQKAFVRIEYPSELLFGNLPAAERPTNCVFTLDIHNIRKNEGVNHTFDKQPPDGSQLVRFFVLPPLKLSSAKIGEIIPAIPLRTLTGDPVTTEDFPGKILVLCWFQDHATSKSVLPRIQKAAADLKRLENEVVFLAVNTDDPTDTSPAGVTELMQQIKVDLRVYRDSEAAGRDLLGIVEAPTTVVLDKNGRLQLFEVGANPQMRELLATTIEQIAAGQDFGSEIRQRHLAEVDAYQRQLELARISEQPSPTSTPTPKVELPPAQAPEKLSMRSLWQTQELNNPGNITLLSDATQQLAVMEGTRRVALIGLSGSIDHRFDLPIPQEAVVTRLRTAVAGDGERYFVGFSQLGQQAFVFDDQFQLRFAYPQTPEPNRPILDAQILDLNEDGELEIFIGFNAPVGIHRVNMKGERVWSNRTSPGVPSITLRRLARPQYLLITNDSGLIRSVSNTGQEGPPITVPNRTIHQLIASRSPTTQPTQFLGMSLTIEGRLIALGLTNQLQEAWSYGLPQGTYQSQVEICHSAQLWNDAGYQWLLVGPDGSIHVIGDEGNFFDYFRLGNAIDGLSAYRLEDKGVIVVSTDETVIAYELSQ